MAIQRRVRVFSFRAYDNETGEMKLANFKATPDSIAARFRGELLEGTGHDVAPEEIDEHGRFRRIATGWGELE